MSAGRLEPEFDRRLVEAAVLAAVRGRPAERAFHAERDPLYVIAEPEAREAAFDALHARWFRRLALEEPFVASLAEEPAVAAGCGRWLVVPARGRRDEGGDLLVAAGALPTLVVRVTAETVAAPERLATLLRRELLHAADMLDPRFGYAASLPPGAPGGPRERAVREHYRVVWGAFVDGRLVRRGRLPARARAERLAEFARVFGAGVDAFARFFDRDDVTHADLIAFAADPARAVLP